MSEDQFDLEERIAIKLLLAADIYSGPNAERRARADAEREIKEQERRKMGSDGFMQRELLR